MKHYVARVCWNPKRWVRPTGDAQLLESANSFVRRNGFGLEEWLFNFEWVLDGWKYAFLQPVNRSHSRLSGETISVLVYTIGPEKKWFRVGEIQQCEVLSLEAANVVVKEFEDRGWLDDMRAQVKHATGNAHALEFAPGTEVFNIRFRPESTTIYDPVVFVEPGDALRKYRRYTLVELAALRDNMRLEWATRVATDRRPTGERLRQGTLASEVDLVHNQLQQELYDALREKFGNAAVVMEEDHVDVKLRQKAGVVLFEVKSDPDARVATRQALGQLLEYAHRCERNERKVKELVVVAPGPLDDLARQYLKHLRLERGLPVSYLCWRRGMSAADLPSKFPAGE